MKAHLFYSLLAIFIVTSVVTLLGITKVILIDDGYLKVLTGAFLIELSGAIITLFKGVDFFSQEDARSTSNDNVTMVHAKASKVDSSDFVSSEPKRIEVDDRKVLPLNDTVDVSAGGEFMQSLLESPQKICDYVKEVEASSPSLDGGNRKDICRKFLGCKVSWELKLNSIDKTSETDIQVTGNCKIGMGMVYSGPLKLSMYPECRFLKKNDLIVLEGEIKEIEFLMLFTLQNTKLKVVGQNAAKSNAS